MLYNKNKIPVMVNYSRRFVSEFEKIKCDIQNNKYGEFISGSGYYGKGVLHNGSHMIDFLRYAIGEIKDTNFINSNFDFYRDDPSISAILTFKNNKKFIMQSIPCSNYTIFEIDLLFEKKRVRIIDSGFKIEIYDVLDSEIFKTYKNLVKILEKETDLGKSLENAVMNIYNYLENKEKLICSLEDGFKAIKIVEMLKGEI